MGILRWARQNMTGRLMCGPWEIGKREADGYLLCANGRGVGVFDTEHDAKNYVALVVAGAVAFTDEKAYEQLEMAEAEVSAYAEDTARDLQLGEFA